MYIRTAERTNFLSDIETLKIENAILNRMFKAHHEGHKTSMASFKRTLTSAAT